MRGALPLVFALAACGRFNFGDKPDARRDDAPSVGDDGDSSDATPGCPEFAMFCDDFEGGDLSTIAIDLAVLAGVAATLIGLAVWRMRSVLSS